jgi:hypothetical protein
LKETDYLLKMRELEKQLEDQRKLAEEMKRRAEQGSMQLQGEAQELALEDLLRTSFPFDAISEVGKGVRGAIASIPFATTSGRNAAPLFMKANAHRRFQQTGLKS